MANFIGQLTIDGIWRSLGQTYANNVLLDRLPGQSTSSSALMVRLRGNSGTFEFVTPAKTVYVVDTPLLLNLRPLWDQLAGEVNWGLLWTVEGMMRYNSDPAEFIIYEVY